MFVMLVFLGLRTGLVIASLIPMAMVMALMIMGFLEIGLDQMLLVALIIALGMLVDNAIVMSESIMVQMGEGKPAMKAAFDSARELRIPLLVSSLTTAAAFLPIYLAESTVGGLALLKDDELVRSSEKQFIQGALKKGLSQKSADEIWQFSFLFSLT